MSRRPGILIAALVAGVAGITVGCWLLRDPIRGTWTVDVEATRRALGEEPPAALLERIRRLSAGQLSFDTRKPPEGLLARDLDGLIEFRSETVTNPTWGGWRRLDGRGEYEVRWAVVSGWFLSTSRLELDDDRAILDDWPVRGSRIVLRRAGR